jgi:hypothetical protein
VASLEVQFDDIREKFFAGQHDGYFLKKRWLLKCSLEMPRSGFRGVEPFRLRTSAGLRRATLAPRAKPTYAIKTARFKNTQLRDRFLIAGSK